MNTVAFIGLGNMGGPMAVNLVKAGYTVKAFDLSQVALSHVVEQGAMSAPSACAAAAGQPSLRVFAGFLTFNGASSVSIATTATPPAPRPPAAEPPGPPASSAADRGPAPVTGP